MAKSLNSCRICLTDSCEKSVDNDEILLHMFEFCTGLIIGDTLPRLLCNNCINEIQQYAKFKKKCAESELYWETFRNGERCKNKEMVVATGDTDSLEEFADLNLDIINNDFLHHDIKDDRIKECQYNKTTKRNKKCAKRKRTLLSHNELIKNEIHNCGLCDFTCSNAIDLNDHLANHWTKNNLKCNETCNYLGRDFADMVTHRYNHEASKVFTCFVCKTKKGSALMLQYHFRNIHLNKVGGWCEFCGKSFQIFKSWRRHMLFHKRDKKLLVCDYCDKRYLYKYQIEEHIIHHLRKSQFVCETCGKGFNKKFNLKCHQRNMHSLSVPVKCAHCDKTYKNQDSLEVHMKEVTREKPFICELCSKGFSLPSLLRKHSFFHSGQKPFICDVCGLKYKTKGSLKCHQLKHLGIFKHNCPKCMRSFTTSVQLRRHLTVHTGDRKFKCRQCDKSFNEKSRLEVHTAKHRDTTAHVKTES